MPVTFSAIPQPIIPKDHLDQIARYLDVKHSPMRADGRGNLSYLSAISDDFGKLLLDLAHTDADRLRAVASADDEAEDVQSVLADPTIQPTDRLLLSKARIGQGLFRKSVLAIEPACRVTGVTAASLLRASHIKPWRDSTNAERLDGANGLMLAPHIDLLFDRFLISFSDDGKLLISKDVDKTVRQKWHLANSASPRPFNEAQSVYLATHRARLA